jgi:hypothetical protein
MSLSKESWLDRYWTVLVILFGLLFVTVLITFKPGL